MADHALVKHVLGWLENWNTNNAAKPTLIDRDDATSPAFNGRRVRQVLSDNHAVSVASSPERQTTAIGTGYDHRVEDAVNVRLEGAHVDEHGTIADSEEWGDIIAEAKRVTIGEQRTSFPAVNGVDYHTVLLGDENNRTVDYKDAFWYDFDILFRGYDDLP
jgi:hypothetical protein